MESIADRIQSLMNNKGLTAYQLGKKANISAATLSRLLTKNTKPNSETILKLCNYFETSEQYLLTGKEETLTTLQNTNGNKFKQLENGKFIMTVPLVPAKAYATYISECCDGETIDGFNEVNFYVDQYARGNYVAFEIKGDSMDNGGLYDNPEGCITLCRELGKQHWRDGFRDAQYGWIIVHQDTILCKDIIEQDLVNGIIKCHSRNTSPEYPDFEVNLNEVKQIFKIIKRTF